MGARGQSVGRGAWQRFVAIGDSFTEGVGDDSPESPNGVRGWADRAAETLAQSNPDFEYANLAIRGRLLDQIADEQVEAALALEPDLITISAGGNDIIRPGSSPDSVARRFDALIERLASGGADIVIFTGVDVGFSPVFRRIRGKVAIYNENLRGVASRHGAIVADQWSLREVQRPEMWAPDRLHLNELGHHEVARLLLDTLGAPHDLEPLKPKPRPALTWRASRREDLAWAREHLVPWVMRRIRHESSGDSIDPKYPAYVQLGLPDEPAPDA